MLDDVLYVLFLEGALLTPLMARQALKSNVTWSSYPFLPPTGASGCLAELVTGGRWHEGNSLELDARRLDQVHGYEGVFALGAYPSEWRASRRHFRSHLGSIFNYEAAVWSAGQNEGKKLAVVEEILADTLTFVVASHSPAPLATLHESVRGRLTALAKKGSLQLNYLAEPDLAKLNANAATGQELSLTMVLVAEMGSLPQRRARLDQILLQYTPFRSRRNNGRMEWDVAPCIWEERLKLRPGVPVFSGEHKGELVALSRQIWGRIRTPWT